MLRNNQAHGLPRLLVLVLISVPVVGWCTSGEVLLKELRQQVNVQRQKMSSEELQGTGDAIGRDPHDPGSVVECTSEAIAGFRAKAGDQLLQKGGVYIYNASYIRWTIPIGNKYCVYLSQPVDRGLTVDEARDLYVADHLEFPRYDPPEADRRVAEDRFLALRDKARVKRATMTQQQRDSIETVVDHLVECSDQELSSNGVWRETGYVDENDAFGTENYVWGGSHSSDGDPCFYVRSPLHRGLTVDEARDLLTVSNRSLPSMTYAIPISSAGMERNSRRQTDPHVQDQKKMRPF